MRAVQCAAIGLYHYAPIMTELHCYAASNGRPLWRANEPEALTRRLADINVRYAHVELPTARLDELADQDEAIEAFRHPLDDLMQHDGFIGLDVSTVQHGQPDQADLHRQFMTAHAHAGVEGHLMVEGSGAFFMRAGDDVYALHSAPGDFVRVPGGLRHWFDMGRRPGFRSIRFYVDADALETVGDGIDMRGMFPPPAAS